MRELILMHIGDFVEMDTIQTVKLCEQWFDSDYPKLATALKD